MQRSGCAILILLSTTLLSLHPAVAQEDGAPLPCNSLCRSWMSMGEPDAAPATEIRPAAEQAPLALTKDQPIAVLQAAKPRPAPPARTEKADRAPAGAVAVLPPRRPTGPNEPHPALRKLAVAAPVPPARPVAPEATVALAPAPAAIPTPVQSTPAMMAAVEVPSVPEPKVVLPPAPEPHTAISPPSAPVAADPEPRRPNPVIAAVVEPLRTAKLNPASAEPSRAIAAPVSKAAPMSPPPFDVIAALLLGMPRTQTPSR